MEKKTWEEVIKEIESTPKKKTDFLYRWKFKLIDLLDIRQIKWFFQRRKRGFDDRELWSLDITMLELLEKRVARYLELVNDHIDLNDRLFTIDGETKSQKEWAIEILTHCEKSQDWKLDYKEIEYHNSRVWEIWKHISPAMWN